MCGIFFSARNAQTASIATTAPGTSNLTFQKLSQRLETANGARGPDAQRFHRAIIRGNHVQESPPDIAAHDSLELTFFASELRLRGDHLIEQPHEKSGDILCWNGEVFEGMDIDVHENDGVKLFDALRELYSIKQLPGFMDSLEGPYAFVFYHSSSQNLYFARDPLGRRSLLIHKPSSLNPYFLLASVSVGPDAEYEMEELSTEYIYSLDLRRLSSAESMVAGFDSCLTPLPRQGGEPDILSPLRYSRPCRVNKLLPPSDLPRLESLDHIPDSLSLAVDDLISHLERSVMLRVRDIPQAPNIKGKARVAVLFSGGIDSTIITLLAHRHIPLDEPIDLLNVAFENPRKMLVQAEGNIGALSKKRKKQWLREMNGTFSRSEDPSYLVPDRVTGLEEVAELRRLCPGRFWNFVEVNVPYEESQAARSTVEALMFPGRTVMDFSLAIALYFASRGVGRTQSAPDAHYEDYTSPARVLLNGLGSDELLGGYGRHRTAFKHGAWEAVIEELQLEIDRIPARNLGRDDRVISSHGKETRHPFLSLSVVSFLAQLPVHFKVDPRLDVGLGDKMLLRLAARKLGLVEASERKKRAMQFGSHSARMEGGQYEKRGDILLP